MRIADLYIRVSAEEGADRELSRKRQEKSLRRFCIIHALRIGKVIFEEHSGKTFQRTQWTRYIAELRASVRQPDLLLFTTWDRFSMDAAKAFRMRNILGDLGTGIQATEQPLDLSATESRVKLSFYLASRDIRNYSQALQAISWMTVAKDPERIMTPVPAFCDHISRKRKRPPVKQVRQTKSNKCFVKKGQVFWPTNSMMHPCSGTFICPCCRLIIPGDLC